MITSHEEKKTVRKLHPFLLMLLLLSVVASQVFGQEARSSQEFAAFWAQFKAAVAKDDREAVASMTEFPVVINDVVSKATFIKIYPEVFNRKVRRCFAKEKPLREDAAPGSKQGGGSYSLLCGDDIFTFERVGGKYKFTGRGVND